MVINGDKKIYSLVPVSSLFFVGNVFLLLINFAILSYLILFIISWIFVGSIALIIFILSSGVNLFTEPGQQVAVASLVWKGEMLVGFICIIFTIASTAISFHKNKIFRKGGIVALGAIVYSFLFIIKLLILNLPSPEGFDFVIEFSNLPQADNILIWSGVTALVVIPLSIYTGYRFYGQRN